MPVKNEEAYKKIIEKSKNNDYTTGNLLDFTYFKENCRLIAIDLSKKQNLKTHNKLISLVNSKDKTMKQQCFSSLKKQKKLLLNFTKFCKNLTKMETQKIVILWNWIFKICNNKMVRYWQWNKG